MSIEESWEEKNKDFVKMKTEQAVLASLKQQVQNLTQERDYYKQKYIEVQQNINSLYAALNRDDY